jgi:hypothetical protein
MAALDFAELVKLINYSRTTWIDPEPTLSAAEGWSLHEGRYQVHSSTFPFRVLSFHSRATKELVQRASREAFVSGETQVVYPPSLEARMPSLRASFAKTAKGFWTIKDYLASFMRDELSRYLERVRSLRADDFIDPLIRVPIGVPRKYPNPLLSFLRFSDAAASSGALGVLLAEPGQGKTYLARQTAAQLTDNAQGPIPIFIDSSQWQGLPVDALSSLAKTIAHSFRHFECPIAWLDGHEDEFLRITLKADMFRVVFDGFDEYVLANGNAAGAAEVLDALTELASSTESRILITSRTTFWRSSVEPASASGEYAMCPTHEYEFEPFDVPSAERYFLKRLSADRAKRALRLFEQLRQRSEDLAGRGFVLSLIADIADSPGEEAQAATPAGGLLHWLFDALCQREQLRQQLPLSSKEQLQVLGLLALDFARSEAPNSELIDFALAVVRPDLSAEARQSAIEKMRSHPLLEWRRQDDSWGFRQEQAEVFFLAQQICALAPDDLQTQASRVDLSSGRRQDVAASIVDMLVSDSDAARTTELSGMVSLLSGRTARANTSPDELTEGRRLAGTIVQTAPDRLLPRGASHKDRAKLFMDLAGGTRIEGFVFSGTLARLDCRSVEFTRCVFEHVTWAASEFDGATKFIQCRFSGALPPQKCTGFGDAKFIDCNFDADAAAWMEAIKVREGKKAYDANALRRDLEAVLFKFLGKGGVGSKTVTGPALTRGIFGVSRHREEILEVLKSTVLEQHHVSGTSEKGYHVKEEAKGALQFFAANNVFTGPLKQAYDSLSRRLKIAD